MTSVVFRRTALFATSGVVAALAAVLPATPALADGTLTPATTAVANGDPAAGSVQIAFTTSDTYAVGAEGSGGGQSGGTITVTLTRVGSNPAETLTPSQANVAPAMTGSSGSATFNLALANPGAYSMSITGPTLQPPAQSTTDSCASCVTVYNGTTAGPPGAAPTVSSVSPASVTSTSSNSAWTINGHLFANGPYTQCSAVPCPANKATVAIVDHATGAVDPKAVLGASTATTESTIKMPLSFQTGETGGARDVVVTNTDGKSATCSSCLTITSPTGVKPTNVVATAGDQQATITWTAPTTTSDTITGYTVQAATGGTQSTPAPASATSATVAQLTNGTKYTFTVTAKYQSGNSATSDPSNEVTPSGKPDAPTNVQATAGNASATVSWTAPAKTGGAPIDSYTVSASPGNAKQIVTGSGGAAPATSTTVSGLTNGTSYTFTVTAHNSGGTSPASAPSNAVTPTGSGSHISLHSPSVVTHGQRASLSGVLTDSNGQPISGATISIYQRPFGASGYSKLTAVNTTGTGQWFVGVKPSTTTAYRAIFAGDSNNGAAGAQGTVRVRETGRITSPKNGSHVSAGKQVVSGHATSRQGSSVAVQKKVGGTWKTIASGHVGANGAVKLTVTLSKGTAVLRLKVAGSGGTLTGYSPAVKVSVG